MSGGDPVTQVRAGLREFLSAQLPGAANLEISNLRRSGGGSSRENWSFDASWTEDGVSVIRELLMPRDPPSSVVATGRNVEFDLLRVLQHAAVPTPDVCWLDAEGKWLERPMMVMTRHPGRAHRAVLKDANPLGLTPAQRVDLGRQFADLLAAVHLVDVDASGVGRTLPRPRGSPAGSEVAHWVHELDRQSSSRTPHCARRSAAT
jgi:aminoglycoside phosphotransferase (APT) family kinase protein